MLRGKHRRQLKKAKSKQDLHSSPVNLTKADGETQSPPHRTQSVKTQQESERRGPERYTRNSVRFQARQLKKQAKRTNNSGRENQNFPIVHRQCSDGSLTTRSPKKANDTTFLINYPQRLESPSKIISHNSVDPLLRSISLSSPSLYGLDLHTALHVESARTNTTRVSVEPCYVPVDLPNSATSDSPKELKEFHCDQQSLCPPSSTFNSTRLAPSPFSGSGNSLTIPHSNAQRGSFSHVHSVHSDRNHSIAEDDLLSQANEVIRAIEKIEVNRDNAPSRSDSSNSSSISRNSNSRSQGRGPAMALEPRPKLGGSQVGSPSKPRAAW